MSATQLDCDNFRRNISKLYSAWPKFDVDALVVIFGRSDPDVPNYSKSSTVHKWLFGYELTDTILIIADGALHIATSAKKMSFLGSVEQALENIKVHLHVKPKGDCVELLKTLGDVMGKFESFGYFHKDQAGIARSTGFSTSATEALLGGRGCADVSMDFAKIMASKSTDELVLMQKASKFAAEAFKKGFRENIMAIIDKNRKEKHSSISNTIENLLPDDVESAYVPIVQSGGNYALKYSTVSDNDHLHFGTIVTMLGVRYRQFCANIGRTILINPDKEREDNYTSLLELQAYLISILTPGSRLDEVYDQVKKKCPSDLRDSLVKSFGTAIGLEFRDNSLAINGRCQAKIEANMVFNLGIGFHGLEAKDTADAKSRVYSLFLADTVVVSESGNPNKILTEMAKSRMKSVTVRIEEEEESDVASEGDVGDPTLGSSEYGRGRRQTDQKEALKYREMNAHASKDKQKPLIEKMNKLALERYNANASSEKSTSTSKLKEPESYESGKKIPYSQDGIETHKLCIDRANSTILLPVAQLPVPIHISLIRNVTVSSEANYRYLRMNFFNPGSSTVGRPGGAAFNFSDKTFVKELTFRALAVNGSHFATIKKAIDDIQKKLRAEAVETLQRKGLVKQDKLVVDPEFRCPRLKAVYMRPSMMKKRVQGMLEAHKNGFRFQNANKERVDIMFNNIKNALFQPCDQEMIIVLHIQLKNFLLLNGKKVEHIQFYSEVGELTTDLSKAAATRDNDGIEEERRERENRNRLKHQYNQFIERVEKICKDVEFDAPVRELGFQGCPARQQVFLQPTARCLMNVVDWPPFVVSMDEVECVHFERVTFSGKTIDVVLIFKDYSRKVQMISAVPAKHMEKTLKPWLSELDILTSEGPGSLNWDNIMKKIVEDVEGFVADGGWDFLQDDGEDASSGCASDQSDVYSESESESDSESDYSSSEFDESEESAYSDVEEGSDESGKDWDELEREAAKADRNRGQDSDEETNNGKRRKQSNAPASKRARRR